MILAITLGTRKGLFQFRKMLARPWQCEASDFLAAPVIATLYDTR